MSLLVRVRLVLARRPWIIGLISAAGAVGAGFGTYQTLEALHQERDRWGSTVAVVVADRDLAPGDPPEVHTIEIPTPLVPQAAVAEVPTGARLRQRVASGEVLVEHDLTTTVGPARSAPPGTLVVAVRDPLAAATVVGVEVHVVADGAVLARSASIVEVAAEVVYIAVPAADAAAVAGAAVHGAATLVYVP